MRATLSVLIASAIVAAPAVAQEANNIAVPDENIATNATNEAIANGLTAGPEATTAPAVPPVFEDEEVTDATVTPESDGGGGLPWGLLGLLGLIGLLGRRRT